MNRYITSRLLTLCAVLVMAACTHDESSVGGGPVGGSGGSGSSSGSSSSSSSSSGSSGSSSSSSSSSSGASGGSSSSSSSSGGSSSSSGSSSGAATPNPAVTPVGTPISNVSQATIGSAGGSVSSFDGRLTVTIPAGALAQNTTIGVQTITNNAPGGLGDAFRLTPNGQTFTQPVSLTYQPAKTELDGTDQTQVALAFQTSAGMWQVVPGVAAGSAQNTYTATTTHFTDYGFYAHAAIKALPLTLKGETQTIAALGYQTVPDPGNAGSPGVVGVATYFTNPKPQWSVNGVVQPASPGQFGNITDPMPDNTNYFATAAPYALPTTGNPVALAAAVTLPDGSRLTVVRNVIILAHQFHIAISLKDSRVCGQSNGPSNGYNMSTSASFDVSLADNVDHSNVNSSISNISPEVDPPDVQNFMSCLPQIPTQYEPSMTHGMALSGVDLRYDKTQGMIHLLLAGSWTDFPAFTTQGRTSPEDRSPLTGLSFFYFKGFATETNHYPYTAPVGQGSASSDYSFTATVTQE